PVLARGLLIENRGSLGLQLQRERHLLRPNSLGCGFAVDARSPGYSVQTLIAQHHTVGTGLWSEIISTFPTPHTPDLEDVGEICCEADAQRHSQSLHSVVDH